MDDLSAKLTPLGVMVLALLREGDMHPYEMMRLMRHRRDDRLVPIQNGTFYHTVGRLERAGLLAEVGVDRDGNRPERTTYTLTDSGRDIVLDWVRRELPRTDRPAEFRVALAEAHNLPREEVARPSRRPPRRVGRHPRDAHPRPCGCRSARCAAAVPRRARPRSGAPRGRTGLARQTARPTHRLDAVGHRRHSRRDPAQAHRPPRGTEIMTDSTRAAARAASAPTAPARSPWPALWALVIGFFMILVDTTIVSVANPAIKAALDPDTNNLDNVVWVTSAYLLAYAVPLLITGRLGDRFGPKRIYLIGLVIFTLASLWCGLSGTLELLIVARAVQGLGAALMTPQTMAVITRTFPPDRRGAAMGLWGATAGCRDPRRPARRRPARGRLRLGVDLLHQRARRHRRLRDGVDLRAAPSDARAPLRHPGRDPQCRGPVPHRVRSAGGGALRLGSSSGDRSPCGC